MRRHWWRHPHRHCRQRGGSRRPISISSAPRRRVGSRPSEGGSGQLVPVGRPAAVLRRAVAFRMRLPSVLRKKLARLQLAAHLHETEMRPRSDRDLIEIGFRQASTRKQLAVTARAEV